jgi:hypothetical protein
VALDARFLGAHRPIVIVVIIVALTGRQVIDFRQALVF